MSSGDSPNDAREGETASGSSTTGRTNFGDAPASASPQRDSRVILDEMLESIRLIKKYAQDLSYEAFTSERMVQDAIILRIAILGEAASHVPSEDKARWTHVPWRVIADTRNRLIHGYFSTRLDLVWQVVTKDLPLLERELQHIRDSLP